MQRSKRTLTARRAAVLLALVLIPTGLGAQQHQTPDQPQHAGQGQEGPCMMIGKARSGMMSEGMMGTGAMGGGMQGMMQDHMQGMDTMTDMVGGRATMRAMHLQPGRILSLREDLGLTSEQLTRLESLAGTEHAAASDATPAMPAEQQQLEALFAAEQPDTAQVRAVAERFARRRGAVYVQMLTTAAAVRGILTPEQLEQAIALRCPMAG